MTDARNFLFNSDYPIDKIIYSITGSISVPNSTNDAIPIIIAAHGLTFTPLVILQWSNTSDFAITNEIRDAQYISNSFTGTGAGQSYTCSSNTTNIVMYRYNFSGGAKTVYYRIFGFMPSDASENSVVPSTSVSGSDFILNTDYNYLKLFSAGMLTTTSKTFDHNLGYIPRVQTWEQSGSTCSRLITAQDISNDPSGSLGQTSGVYITTTQIVWLNPSTYNKIHFRIYADE